MVVGAFMYMILIQPDLGTTVIIGCWLMIMLFVAGLNLFHILAMIDSLSIGVSIREKKMIFKKLFFKNISKNIRDSVSLYFAGDII